MGDAGALFLGVLLATLTVRFQPTTDTQIGAYLTPVFLLAIPIMDTSVAVLSRVRRHLSPFQGGQDHLSHRLIRAGASRKQSAFILWGLSTLFAAIACYISLISSASEIVLISISVIAWICLFLVFLKSKNS
jgi:UDP-GlcNAc:undecaprenyl-phosphate GlcNAc-1-phosphate transferase